MLFVIEGTDGAGKATQTAMLVESLCDSGVSAKSVAFPMYSEPSSALVTSYLSGVFGKDANCVPPKLASALYACDRALSAPKWIDIAKDQQQVVVADRYYGSNAIHQASAIKDIGLRQEMFDWIHRLEVMDFGLPEPDMTFLLAIDPREVQRIIHSERKVRKSGATSDILEDSLTFQMQSYLCSLDAAAYFGWTVVDCMKHNGVRKTPIEINEEIKVAISNRYSAILQQPKTL